MRENQYVSPTYKLNQEQINQFAEASGGTGKIHTDPEYARQTPFGGTLVHGLLLFALIEKELDSQVLDWSDKGMLETTFVKPVITGQEFSVVFDKTHEHEMVVSVFSREQTVVSGKVVLL